MTNIKQLEPAALAAVTSPNDTAPSYAVEETITPERAKAMLAKNHSNRKVSKALVKRYVKEIQDGLYAPNGQTVSIDTEGFLHDGQHRLLACVQAGLPIRQLVAYNVRPETRITVDAGRSRTVGDNLNMTGTKYGSQVAAAATLQMRYEREGRALDADGYGTRGRSRGAITPRMTFDWVKAHPSLEASVYWVHSRGHRLKVFAPLSAVSAAHWVTRQIDEAKHETFFGRLVTGEGLELGNPILTLRDRDRRSRLRRANTNDTIESLGFIIKAWNHYVCGLPLHNFRPTVEFPQWIDWPEIGMNRDQLRGLSPHPEAVLEAVDEVRSDGLTVRYLRLDIDATLAKLGRTRREILFARWPVGSLESALKRAITVAYRRDRQALLQEPADVIAAVAEATREDDGAGGDGAGDDERQGRAQS